MSLAGSVRPQAEPRHRSLCEGEGGRATLRRQGHRRMAGDLPRGAQERFDTLAQMLVSVESSREATMSKIAELACGLVDGCDYVSLTVVDRGRPETVGATDDRAVDVDAAQYR